MFLLIHKYMTKSSYITTKRKYMMPEVDLLCRLLKERLNVLNKLQRKRLPKAFSFKEIAKVIGIKNS